MDRQADDPAEGVQRDDEEILNDLEGRIQGAVGPEEGGNARARANDRLGRDWVDAQGKSERWQEIREFLVKMVFPKADTLGNVQSLQKYIQTFHGNAINLQTSIVEKEEARSGELETLKRSDAVLLEKASKLEERLKATEEKLEQTSDKLSRALKIVQVFAEVVKELRPGGQREAIDQLDMLRSADVLSEEEATKVIQSLVESKTDAEAVKFGEKDSNSPERPKDEEVKTALLKLPEAKSWLKPLGSDYHDSDRFEIWLHAIRLGYARRWPFSSVRHGVCTTFDSTVNLEVEGELTSYRQVIEWLVRNRHFLVIRPKFRETTLAWIKRCGHELRTVAIERRMEMIVFQMWPAPVKAYLAHNLRMIKEAASPIKALELCVKEWDELSETAKRGWIVQNFRYDKRLEEMLLMLTKEVGEAAETTVVEEKKKFVGPHVSSSPTVAESSSSSTRDTVSVVIETDARSKKPKERVRWSEEELAAYRKILDEKKAEAKKEVAAMIAKKRSDPDFGK